MNKSVRIANVLGLIAIARTELPYAATKEARNVSVWINNISISIKSDTISNIKEDK